MGTTPESVREFSGSRHVLVDFGAGRDRLPSGFANTVDTAGTPLFIAPELWRGEGATAQSDLYSVGVLLFYLVSGTYPTTGATLDEVREAHRSGLPSRRLREVRSDLPQTFVDIVERAIAPEPQRRFDTAAAMRAALMGIEEVARRAAVRRRRWLTGAGLTVAGGLAVYAALCATDTGVPRSENRRQIPSQISGIPGTPSRNGRYMTYVAGDALDVWLMNVADGRARQVTHGASTGWHAEFSAPSPDGSQVVYSWEPWRGAPELWMSQADGTNARRLLTSDQADIPKPLQWSRDGTVILCQLFQKDGRRDLALVSTEGRPLRTLVSITNGEPQAASLSPDGRFVVFDDFAAPGQPQRDIFIVGTDGPSSKRALVSDLSDDRFPFWTADGRVVFLSNRLRQVDAFALSVVDGVATGAPVLAAREMGTARPIGLSDAGTLFYRVTTNNVDVHTVEMDLDTPNSVRAPVLLPGEVLGDRLAGSWSPDGTRLAYLNRKDKRVGIFDVRAGASRELPVPLTTVGNMPPRWSPERDSAHVLIRGEDRQNRSGYFRLHVQSGDVTPVWLYASLREADAPPQPVAWSHDGTSLLFLDPGRGILSRDLSTGDDTVVVRREELPATVTKFVVSPDGRSLAMSGPLRPDPPDSGHGVWIRTAGGPVVNRHSFNEFILLQEWTGDGKYLTLTRLHDATSKLWQLAVLPVAGGPPRDLGPLPGYTPNNRGVWVTADGRRASYTQGFISARLWVMEHFLPAVPGSSK